MAARINEVVGTRKRDKENIIETSRIKFISMNRK